MRNSTLSIVPLIRVAPFLVAGLCVSVSATAGNPTKDEPVQPGAEDAALIDAGEFDSLQEAFDALPDGGGKVILPAGRFEIREPLLLRKGDVMVQGAGTASHIVNLNENNQPALVVVPPDGAEKLWRVQLTDFRITGNPQGGAGIHAKNVDELLISRLAVEHNGGDGIILDHCYEDPRVCDNLITYNDGTGLNLLGCHDIVVSANQFEENADALRCLKGYNLTMTGNNIDDHLGNGVVIQDTYGSVLSGNMIEECKGWAVILRGVCYGDTLSANTFSHSSEGGGVHVEGAKSIALSANTFVLCPDAAILVTDGAEQLTITGNMFNRYPFDPTKRHKLDPAQGIVLRGVRDVTIGSNTFVLMLREAIKVEGENNARLNITGNTVVNPSQEEAGKYAAISLASLNRSIISNNICTDDQETPTMKCSIEMTGECEKNIVQGNVFGTQGKLDIPGRGNEVKDNIVD